MCAKYGGYHEKKDKKKKGKIVSNIAQSVMFGFVGDQVLGLDMGAMCANGTAQAAATGVGQGCVAADSNGVGWTAAGGGGLGFGATLSGTVGLEVSNGTIADQAGDGAFINPALGFGGRLDGVISSGMDETGTPTGIWAAGINVGGSYGGTLGTVGGTHTKTGYWFEWSDFVFW